MTTHSFAYIHSNHTTPFINGLKLPFDIRPQEIQDLSDYPYENYDKNIILFSLTGQTELREQEEKLIQNIISASKNATFLIITPFRFEAGVDLNWILKQLTILQNNQVNFEVLELNAIQKEEPHLTFDQAFRKIQEVIELIASVTYGTFRG